MNPLSFSFWLFFIYFIFALFVAFYIPGNIILKKINLASFPRFVLSCLTGMVLWSWQGYIFGYLGLRWLSYVYLFVFIVLWIKDGNLSKKNIFNFKKIDYLLLIIVLTGILFQLTSVWFTGIQTKSGMFYCCGMWPDNVLNIAYTNQVVNHFPPYEPGYYGKLVSNYHYWDSLVMGELVRVFELPLAATDYQYMTIFISLFLGLVSIAFSKILNLGKCFTRWLTLLLYFGGDLVWLLVLFLRGRDIFNMNPMESGQQFLENLPRAFSIVVLLGALSLFMVWIKKKDFKLGVILALLFSALIGFKIYVGLFILPGLGLLALYYLFKKEYKYLLLFISTLILSIIIYLPVNSGAGGFFYTGTWRFENFISQGFFGLQKLELARATYIAQNNWKRVIEYELFYAALFILGTFGTKLLGLIQNKKTLSLLPKDLHILLIPGFIISFILGSFFWQTSGGPNTFNFLVSIFIVGSIYTALSLSHFINFKNKYLGILMVSVFLILTLPRSFEQIYKNIISISKNNNILIDNLQLDGINRLKNIKTNSLVLVNLGYDDIESPYISYYSNQRMFLSGQGDELGSHNVDFSQRKKDWDLILNSENVSSVSAALSRNSIGYLFLLKSIDLAATDSANFLQTIFENKEVKIIKVSDNVLNINSK